MAALPRLRAIEAADLPLGRVAAVLLGEAGGRGLAARHLASRLGVEASALPRALVSEAGVLAVGPDEAILVAGDGLAAVASAVRDTLGRFHRDQPLRPGMPREELRRRFAGRAPEPVLEEALRGLAGTGELRLTADTVGLAAHEVTLSPSELKAQRALLEAALGAGLAGVALEPLNERLRLDPGLLDRVGRVLVEEGVLRRVGEGTLVHRDHLDELKRRVRERWPSGSPLDVAAFKDLTGLTRKHVIPLLEYLDREKVSRRVGAARTVL